MNKGEKYDQMIENPKNDELGFFENYNENMKFIQEHIRTLKPKQVFDIGCGTGNLTGPLSEEISVVGVDQSDEMLVQAKIKYPHMKFVNEEVDKWTLEANLSSGNLVISSFVLHAIQNKNKLLDWFSSEIRNDNTVNIVDYFFKNENERLDFIKKLKTENKNELSNLIESKYFLKIDEMEDWCHSQNFQCQLTMLSHWIGMIEIQK